MAEDGQKYRQPATGDEAAVVRVIAIDGPAGSGKTTLARALAARFGLDYLNTGAMYRAVTFAVLQVGGDPQDGSLATSVARSAHIRVEGEQVRIGGADITAELRSPAVNQAVSAVAAIAGVRTELVEAQRAWARRRGGGVVEGRDIGTVVFPDAALKVYLTVDADEAARRRARQESGWRPDPAARQSRAARRVQRDASALPPPIRNEPDIQLDPRALKAVATEMAHRNRLDSTRSLSPLLDVETASENAVVIDTTNLTCAETVDLIIGHMGCTDAGA